jgi:hypothetical protein
MTQEPGRNPSGDVPSYQPPAAGGPASAPGWAPPAPEVPGPAQPADEQPGEQAGGPAWPPAAPSLITPAMPVAPVPAGMYYDQKSMLTLPDGTELASHGRRVGAYFLAGLLWIVTLVIGYAIWGLVTWGKGRTPVQQLLHMRCWNTREMTTATWGMMFLRGLVMAVEGSVVGGLVSFVMFLVNKDRRTLYDLLSGVVVLHDPNDVLG